MMLLRLRTKPRFLKGGGIAVATSALSSSMEARGKLRRRNDGVANFRFDALEVPTSSSLFRLSGVPANASRKKRLLDD